MVGFQGPSNQSKISLFMPRSFETLKKMLKSLQVVKTLLNWFDGHDPQSTLMNINFQIYFTCVVLMLDNIKS